MHQSYYHSQQDTVALQNVGVSLVRTPQDPGFAKCRGHPRTNSTRPWLCKMSGSPSYELHKTLALQNVGSPSYELHKTLALQNVGVTLVRTPQDPGFAKCRGCLVRTPQDPGFAKCQVCPRMISTRPWLCIMSGSPSYENHVSTHCPKNACKSSLTNSRPLSL